MTVSVDWTELGVQKPRLWVAYSPRHLTLRWAVRDANAGDRVFTRAATFEHAVAFVRAAERCGDATVDEGLLAAQLAFRDGFSVRAPEAMWEQAQAANVVPLFHAQLDESA